MSSFSVSPSGSASFEANRQTVHRPLLFGRSSDELSTNWQQRVSHVSMPKITLPEFFVKTIEDVAKLEEENAGKSKKAQNAKAVGFIFKKLKPVLQLLWERKRADKYLPKEIRSRVLKYRLTTYWWDKLVTNRFKPGFAQQKLVNLKGPLAIKAKQASVNTWINRLEKWENIEKLLPDYKIFSLGSKLSKVWTKRQVKIYSSLVDSTPPLPASYFQKELDKINAAYHAQYGEHLRITDTLGSGSMGQVFLGETDSGKKLAVKVLRPDADIELLRSYDAYLYRMGLVSKGTANKHGVYQEAMKDIASFWREADPLHEKAMGEEFAQWLHQSGVTSFDVPKFLVSLPEGFVQEYAGNMTLSSMRKNGLQSLARQVTTQTAPDFIRAYTLGPKKYFDWHVGNVLLDVQDGQAVGLPKLVDYGKAVRFDEKANQRLIEVIIDTLKHSNVHHVLKNPSASGVSVSTLVNDRAQAASDSELLDKLLHKGDDLGSLLGEQVKIPTSVDFWVNYNTLQNDHPGVRTLMNDPLGLRTLNEASRKFKDMFTQYFSMSGAKGEEEAALRQMSLDSFIELISTKDWAGTMDFYFPEGAPSSQAELRKQLIQAVLDNNPTVFNVARDNLLADAKGAEWLKLLYRQNSRCKSIAKSLADNMVAMVKRTLTSEEMKNLARNIEYGLRHDFGLLIKA